MSKPATARAVRLLEHGQPLRVEEVELPEPGGNEVLVEIEFGGINPVDRYAAEGRVALDSPLPRTLGAEGAGRVDGRPVIVAGEGLGASRDGVWATAAVVPRAAVMELPDGVGTREAAAIGIAGVTAYNVVHELGKVTSDDRVLVLGASGGVGTMIVSLVRAAGATVWGQTGSEQKASLITQDGADRAVVAGPETLADALSGFEPTVVFDPLGDGFLRPVLDAVVPHGRIVTFGTSAGAEVEFNLQTLYRKGISLLGYAGLLLTREQRRTGLERALAAATRGELKVRIDDALALEDVNEALARLLERKVHGNLVLATGG